MWYSEEMKNVMYVRDVTNELGLDVKRLVCGRAHLVLDSGGWDVALNQNKGHIIAYDKNDRETFQKNKKQRILMHQEVTLQL